MNAMGGPGVVLSEPAWPVHYFCLLIEPVRMAGRGGTAGHVGIIAKLPGVAGNARGPKVSLDHMHGLEVGLVALGVIDIKPGVAGGAAPWGLALLELFHLVVAFGTLIALMA